MTKKIVKKLLRYGFLLVGLTLLFFLIRKIGISIVISNVKQIGWLFVPILVISLGWYCLYTTAWLQFLGRLSDGIDFWELFRIKVTGEAVNTLTPANFIGGDPLRIYLLKKNFPVAEGAASVVVDRTLHSAATLVMILLGIAVGFATFDRLPSNIKFGVPIATMVSAVFIVFILVHQRRGFFSLILNLCRRLHLKKSFSEKTINRFTELDEHIMDFYEANHSGFIIAFLCHLVGRLLGVLEIYIVGHIVSDQFTLFTALMLTALAPMVNAVFTFIPGAFGVMEGAYSGVLYIMHLNPSIGITIQIAKRLRSAFWIALGLLFLSAHDRHRVFEDEALIEEV